MKALLLVLTACGGSSTTIDPLRPNACLDAADLAFCDDFDLLEQTAPPFGFGELLGGETTEVVVVAENGNRGLSMRSQGAAFAQSGARPVGSAATSASVQALIEQPAAAPGKSLTLGMLLLDGTTPDGRQVWLVANADGTLGVDALGIAMPTTGRIEADQFTAVAIDAAWTPGAASIAITVRAAPAGEEPAPILETFDIDLAPVPNVSAAVAIISTDPGDRTIVVDNVTLGIE